MQSSDTRVPLRAVPLRAHVLVALALAAQVALCACEPGGGEALDGAPLPFDGATNEDAGASLLDAGDPTLDGSGPATDDAARPLDAADTADGSVVTDAASPDAAASSPDAASPDAGPSCSRSVTPTGRLRVRIGGDVRDLLVTPSTSATLDLEHKIDVDPIEAGCIARFELTVDFDPRGCRFRLELEADRDGFMRVVDVWLDADSFCPGFPDAVEGLYEEPYDPRSSVAKRSLRPIGRTHVADGEATEACEGWASYQFPEEWIRVRRGTSRFISGDLFLDLSQLHLSGRFVSRGATDRRCPAATPPTETWHDGGDGWRTSTPHCSPDYLFTEAGGPLCVRTPLIGYSPVTLPELPSYAISSFSFGSASVTVDFDAVAGRTYELMAFRQTSRSLSAIRCQSSGSWTTLIRDAGGATIVTDRTTSLRGCMPYAFTPTVSGRYRGTVVLGTSTDTADLLAVRVRVRP